VSTTALRLEKQQIPGTTVSIYWDTSAGKPWPYVPAPLRLRVFQSVHELSHPGTKATAKLVAQRFVWPEGLPNLGTGFPVLPAIQSLPPHSYPCGRLHAAGSPFFSRPHRPRGAPYDVSRLHTLPHCSRLLHALARSHPISDNTAGTEARALLTGRISLFGFPHTITTDQGPQFKSQLFHSLTKLCGIKLFRTAAQHAAASGLVERLHLTLKAAIMCHADQKWTEALPPGSSELSWVYLTADCQSTSSFWYRDPLWGPWLDFILSLVTFALLFFL
jgi:cleavage and polyadenylation specificity factor subunit 1